MTPQIIDLEIRSSGEAPGAAHMKPPEFTGLATDGSLGIARSGTTVR